ncbi:hypothetical protein [Prosthecobacter sp.]|uniref:hypothetical protein n=1 Tax=Prosthecobacter sp. TaxID=1965333 RepID=UPI003783AC69
MHPADSASKFQAAVTASGKTVESLGAEGALEQMTAFYRNVRAEDCVLDEEEGDTLLCEWGMHEEGPVPGFQLEFTRHFMEPGNEDEDGMSQLSLTLYYSPSPDLQALEHGTRLCTTPDGANEFERAVRSSEAFQAVAKLKPVKTDVAWYEV